MSIVSKSNVWVSLYCPLLHAQGYNCCSVLHRALEGLDAVRASAAAVAQEVFLSV